MKIRELFRQTLENAEVTPDPSVGVNLMKRVGRQEFLRFDLSRFNVYYLGVVFVAAITAGIIFSGGGTETAQLTTPEIQVSTGDSVDNNDTLIAGEDKVTSPDEGEKLAEPLAVAPVKPVAVANTKPVQKDSSENSPAAVTVRENTEKIVTPARKEPAETRYQDGFRTVVSKIDNSRKTPPREKVVIKPVQIDDSAATEEIINNALPGKDKIKGESEKNEPVASASATEGCPPLEVHFRSETRSSDPVWWSFGDTGTSAEKNPSWIYNNEGEYNVILKQPKKDGSDVNSSLLILVYPKPEAKFEIIPGSEAKSGEELSFVNQSVNSVSYNWNFGDGTTSDQFEPKHKYRKTGKYIIKLIVTSDYGCTDTLTREKIISRK
jgi:PKD repeat protein